MRYRFLDCELDLERCELRRADSPVALRAKTFQLLAYLIEHRERVVSKDELLARVWAGRVVADTTLSSCIKSVRRALGDDGERQQAIKTVRGLGYRFSAELTALACASSVTPPGDAAPAAAASAPEQGAALRPAVAVLPFANMSGDPAEDYFSDGLTEDLITALAAGRALPVIARNSTFIYKNQPVDVRRLGRELGARYLVEGGVRRSGNRLRVTAQLIDSESAHHVWAARYDRAIGEVFELQDDMVRQIAAIVAPEVEQAEIRRSAAKRTADLDAWDHYLRGMALLHGYTCPGNRAAREHFAEALALDPDYCDGWIGMAYSHLRDIDLGCVTRDSGTIERGLEAARRAVTIDEASAAAHLVLGQAYVWAERLELAIAETRTAVELDPNHAHACMALGNRLELTGRTEEGIRQMEHSLHLNPRDPNRFVYLGYLARGYIRLGDYERALEWARAMVRLRPGFADAHYRLAICLGHLGRGDEARAALAECRRLRPGFLEQRAGWQPYPDRAGNEHFFAGLRRLGLLG